MRAVALFIGSLALVFSGCNGEPLPEQKQYEELVGGLKYRTYSGMSRAALPVILGQVNKGGRALATKYGAPLEPKDELDPVTGHLALGLLWILQYKPDFGIAEANIALSMAQAPEEKFVCNEVLALGMYQERWPELSKQTNELARDAMAGKVPQEQMYEKQVVLYLSLGLMAIQKKDLETANVAFAGLSGVTGITWIADVSEIGMLAQGGRIQEALVRLKALSRNPTLPEAERAYVLAMVDAVEAKTGDVESPFFWTNLVGKLIVARLMEIDNSRLKPLLERLEAFRASVQRKG